MATVVKTFSFATTAESWVAGNTTRATYDSTIGNPAGSLQAKSTTSTTASGYWEWTGTWESLGVAAGQSVTFIQLTGGYDRADNVGYINTFLGPYELRDSAGNLLGTLLASRHPSANESAWTTLSGSSISVPSAQQPSNTTIKLRANWALSSTGSTVWLHQDELSFTMTTALPTYTGTMSKSTTHATISATAIVPFRGNASLTTTHPTISASGTRSIPVYSGAASMSARNATISSTGTIPSRLGGASPTATHVTIVAAGTLVVPIYVGTMSVARHPNLAAGTTFTGPNYQGAMSVTTSATVAGASSIGPHAALVTKGYGYGQRILTRGYSTGVFAFTGTANLTVHHPTVAASGPFVTPVYTAVASLSRSVSFGGSGLFVRPIYLGAASVTVHHPTIVAGGPVTTFRGTASLSPTHARIAGAGTYSLPRYFGNAALRATRVTTHGFGVFSISDTIVRGERYITDNFLAGRTIRNIAGAVVRVSTQPLSVDVTLSGDGVCNYNPGF
jgi:hypothetical protein